MKGKYGKKLLASMVAASVFLTELSGAGMMTNPVAVWGAEQSLDVTGEYVFDVGSTWDNNNGKENNIALTTEDVPGAGITLNMDVLIPVTAENEGGLAFSGLIKPVGVLRVGANWDWVQSNDIPEFGAADFTERVTIGGQEYYKKNVSIAFGETVGANDEGGWNGSMPFAAAVKDTVSQVTVQFAGYLCDYAGKIAIANAALVNADASGIQETVLKSWDFEDGIGSWNYDSGWNWQYDGTANTSAAAELGMMKVTADYSQNADKDWSQLALTTWESLAVQTANKIAFDFYYDAVKLDGKLKIKTVFKYEEGGGYAEIGAAFTDVETENAVNAAEVPGMKKVSVALSFDDINQAACSMLALEIIGVNTSYVGDFYVDNVVISNVRSAEDIYVDATKKATRDTDTISVSANVLTSRDAAGADENTAMVENIMLVDGRADQKTQALYTYLKAIGDSESVIFGHQNDTWHKAGAVRLSESDTIDVTNSISGVVGIDTLSLTGNEYSASRYNSEIGDKTFPTTVKGNVLAAAELTNRNIAEGAIITLSAHMPNFSIVKERVDYDEDTDPIYAKYDFTGYTPNTLTGDVMNEILPGGEYNEVYAAYLDMIADYAAHINGTILFRPFHENTGSWFWWGKAFCDPQTYKNVFKYTVEYLRDEKDLHNILYVYGPGSEAASKAEYGERYPGDDYVDMVGFDMYHSNPSDEDGWFTSLANELAIVEEFAEDHGKLVAVTETGVANATDKGDNQTALHKTGNQHLDWYNEMLNAISNTKASYFLLWANFGEKDGFYTPYVKSVKEDGTLHGHEELDYFIDFFNDSRSVFAVNQKNALVNLTDNVSVTAAGTTTNAVGYITAPVSGKRILKPVTLQAHISGLENGDVVTFALINDETEVVLAAANDGGKKYTAALTESKLAEIGAGVGSIELRVNNTAIDIISAAFNIAEAEEDPYEIDGFENYSGVNSLLEKKWATNKATGSSISVTLTDEAGKYCSGNYGMKFTYNETANGWAGATIAKDVDWSDCNALQFWTIPDGNNQKVVIQITAGGKEYEVYLQEYEAYRNAAGPVFVTLPFDEFVDRDGDGPAGGLESLKANIQSCGLWVNAIAGTPAMDEETGMVTGTIYYDKITAVHTDVDSPSFGSVIVSDIAAEMAIAYLAGETDGNYYYEILPADAPAPAGGAAVEAAVSAIDSGTGVIADNETKAITVTGLSPDTAYKLYVTIKTADGNYTDVQSVSFITKKQLQTALAISGVPSGTIPYGSTFTLAATGGSSTGAVSYEVTAGSDCATVAADGKVTITGIGSVTIKVTKAGDETYAPATAKVSFKTVKADQQALQITGVPSTVRLYDTFTLGLTGGNENGKVTYKIIDGSNYAQIDENGKVTITGLGTVTIKATKALTEHYNKATVTRTFTVAKALQKALTVSNVPAAPEYGTSFTLETTGGTGNGAVRYAVTSGSSYASVNAASGKVTITGVGSVSIKVTKAADDKNEEISKIISFTTAKANQKTLTISGVSTKLSAEKTPVLSTKGGSGTGKVTYKVTGGSKNAKVDAKTGKITVTGIGKVTITATKAADVNYNAGTVAVTFTTKLPAKNTKVTIGSLKYQVTKSNNKTKTVTCYASKNKKITKVTVPSAIKIGGVTYKVTAIGKNAFLNCKKLKSITLGSNLTAVGKNALKGIDKKAVIKVPSAKLAKYQKLLNGKGQGKTVKIKK